MFKALLVAVLATISSAVVAQPPASATQDTSPAKVLFWPQARRDQAFQHMETIAPVHVVRHGRRARPLPSGAALPALKWSFDHRPQTLDGYIASEHVAGVLVLQDGRVRLERYGLGFGPKGRWTSFSVAKSFTSTLVGAAVRDGSIKSIEDPITRYLPELAGSAYDGVSIRQVLTMSSGVKWNEDYSDPTSDVARAGAPVVTTPGVDPTLAYLAKLPRESAPGTKWVYKTGETNLIGVLVTRATHKSLADYLSEKIWRPFGMADDAIWVVDANGQETGGCCISATLRDFGRMGQFILEGAHGVLPKGWLEAATHKQMDIGDPGHGYGFQWWTNDDGTFDAIGIFGQTLHIDRKRRLVVVVNSDWPTAVGDKPEAARGAFLAAVTEAVAR